MDFLDYYRDNLTYLRGLAAEFAVEFPKIADRLSLSEFECQDPYVERLLEGTAFLAARVEKKLDDGYSGFLESVLNSSAPSALYPIPSGAVAELELDLKNPELSKGSAVLPAGTIFDAFIPTINTPCRFTSVEDVPLAPFNMEVEYLTRNVASLEIDGSKADAALHIKLTSITGDELPLFNEYLFYINLPDAAASLILRQLIIDRESVYLKAGEGRFQQADEVDIYPVIPTGASSLMGELKGNAVGLKLLKDYLTHPAFYKFFALKGAASAAAKCKSIEFAVTLKVRENSLASLKTGDIKLNCVPIINLFPKRSDRVFIDREAFEFHIVPQRTAVRDYEVLVVKKLEFFNERNENIFTASNFYEEDILSGPHVRNFFSQHRRERLFPEKGEKRSSYAGSEMYISFSSREADLGSAHQFTAELLCTNRDLPLLILPNTPLLSSSPFTSRAAFISTPTRPAYPLVNRGGRGDFAHLGHIHFNLSALLWREGNFPAEGLKELIKSYGV
ncbi:MAG: type VI secretion system baseplate subunit TssF, partial [Deferribacteraceae bacterium]|nr:type VI secretion system baseplate subunit TssF [Deferribacteraceae bacterium]